MVSVDGCWGLKVDRAKSSCLILSILIQRFWARRHIAGVNCQGVSVLGVQLPDHNPISEGRYGGGAEEGSDPGCIVKKSRSDMLPSIQPWSPDILLRPT